MESCSKELFASISADYAEAYWKRNVKKAFQICKNDYKFKVIASWKKLFKQYSKERFDFNHDQDQLIETMVAHCHKIYKYKTTSRNLSTIFDLLAPYKEYLLKMAHSNADAQFFLGYCYQFGHGVNVNLAEAIKYLQRSADQGQTLAKINLGVCFHKGNGVEKDLEKAFNYFKISA